jgi:hypothetical protein
MRSGEVALRISIVWPASSRSLPASTRLTDARRAVPTPSRPIWPRSSSELQALDSQIQALTHQYDVRLKELEAFVNWGRRRPDINAFRALVVTAPTA